MARKLVEVEIEEDDPLLDMKGVSKEANLPPSKIYVYAAAGEMPAFKLGKYWRFRRSELRAWIEKHRVGPKARRRATTRRPV